MTPDPAATWAPEASAPEEDWVEALSGVDRDAAAGRLHAQLLRAARFELRRRGLEHHEIEELAQQAASDALMAILAKLGTFRGESRFTTWAYKFVLLEAAVKARRRGWQGREVALAPEEWPSIPAGGRSVAETAEDEELLAAIRAAVGTALTAHQREVFCALAINGVPIDVLADRLSTTRGALYKSLHDARRKLRSALAEQGLQVAG